MTRMMRDLVEVQGSFKPSVQLPSDFFDEELNRHFVESYIPTPEILEILMEVGDSLQANSEHRARVFASTFGTGKSDFMLMIANYVTRSPDDALLKPFFTRLYRLDHAKAEVIYQARKDKPPFLLVLLQADTASTFSSFILNGLSEALVSAGYGEFLRPTYYQAALDLIQSWENQFPVNIERLQETLKREHGQTLTQLKHDLSGTHADLALDTFQQAVRSAIGMVFLPNTVIKMPYQAFDEVANSLVASGQYSGIFVIADEFTHLLETLVQSSTAGDSKAIDNLAEAASRSGPNQLHFYVVSLEAFASAGVQASTKLAKDALERMGGRFKQHELRSQNTEELISASISKLVRPEHLFDGTLGQEDELFTVAMRLWGQRAEPTDPEWLRDTVVRGCFPLHPLATYCLGVLNRVLAQNERTMFSFIWDQKDGLNRFIQRTAAEISNARLQLLPLEGLFDYFRVSIKEKRPDLWQVYLEADRLLSPKQLKNGLEGQLLRALILLDVASGDPALRADSDLLRHALALPPSSLLEITTALEQLQEHGIAYPSQSGHYQLVKAGRANPLELRRLIERRTRELRGSPLDQLNRVPPKNVEAQDYNKERGTARQLLARFVSPAELSSPATLPLELLEQDGLLCYVVAASDQELAQARSAALRLTEQYKRLVVAVPRRPTDLIMRWKNKQALEELRKDTDYQTSDYKDLLVDKGLVGKDYFDAFQAERGYFNDPKNFELYRAGQPVLHVTTSANLSNFATTVMQEIFTDTPEHQCSQHLTGTRNNPSRKDALDQILQAPFKLKTKGKPAVNALLLDGAGELGLIYQSGSEGGYHIYDVGVPNRERSKAVWDLIDGQLRQAKPLLELVATLLSPPYGLYPPVLQLFVATFYRFNRDYLELYNSTTGQRVDITSKEIIDLVENPSQYLIHYEPLTTGQSQWLQELEQALPPEKRQSLAMPRDGFLTQRVAQSWRDWAARELPQVARKASAEDLRLVFPDVADETLTATALLIESAFLSSSSESAIALLERVPTGLGLPADSSKWLESQLKPVLNTLQKACQQVQDFSSHVKSQLAWQIGQRFGLTSRSSDFNQSLDRALQWRKEHELVKANDDSLNPDAKSLLSVLDGCLRKKNRIKPDFERLFLNDLPSKWGLKCFDEWQQLRTYQSYLQRLSQSITEIEQRAKQLATQGAPSKVATESEASEVPLASLPSEAAREGRVALDSPKTPPPAPEISAEKQSKEAISQPSTAPSVATPASRLLTKLKSPTQSVSQAEEYNIHSSTVSVAEEKVAVLAESGNQTRHHEDEIRRVEPALAEIKAIFSGLSQKEQDVLWKLLLKEYDPQ